MPLLLAENRVERLYQPWVNVPVTCDPRGDLGWLLDHMVGAEGEHAICPLSLAVWEYGTCIGTYTQNNTGTGALY